MSSDKSRKPSDATVTVLKASIPILQPFERLRRFKRVKRYLKKADGSRFAMLEISESDYKTLCRDSSRITLTESDQLPRNDRHVKIFLRKDIDKEENSVDTAVAKENDDKNGNNQKPQSLFSGKSTTSGPSSYAAPSTPRPQKRRTSFGIGRN